MTGSGHSPGGLVSPTLREVWRDPTVRQRIVEYLGGRRLREATCAFLGSLDAENPSLFMRHSPDALDRMLDDGCELARSLEDRVSLLIHLDIEYVNFDDPAAAYVDAPRIFRLQQPLVEAIEACLLAFGIRYLHLVTGQGHHFVWRIPKESAVARAIAELSICTPPDVVTPPADPLFPHLALLMEHFAHLVKRDAAPLCDIPVEITAQHVGPGASGMREMLSIDLSEYGDPLHSRMIRIPYTVYRKPWLSGLISRMGIEDQVNEFFTLPLHEMGLSQLLKERHQPAKITALARRAGVNIPLQERGTARLMDDYLRSDLCAFHRSFYAIPQDHPSQWAEGYDMTPLEMLPPCAAHVLTQANDWLLKPSGIQLVTRCLLALGWHPRHIAGLIRSKFANPAYGWGDKWREYDPAMRAEFYVRLFAGQIATGLDRGIDFNCVSQQEKQFCWNPCGCSLDPFHAGLDERFNPKPTPP
ncbi:MAG: hypothetical protein EHM17_07200 [Verrucomicrobiaceae bacterium]|nr:MAG: hypothetical protein EHM17_07200 [Verrucomicrobiaceae bacterium]